MAAWPPYPRRHSATPPRRRRETILTIRCGNGTCDAESEGVFGARQSCDGPSLFGGIVPAGVASGVVVSCSARAALAYGRLDDKAALPQVLLDGGGTVTATRIALPFRDAWVAPLPDATVVGGGLEGRRGDATDGMTAGTAGAERTNPNSHATMPDETRLERRLDRAVNRATTPRGAAIVIASSSTAITVAAGILMTLVEHDTYPSIGTGLWWAAQTVTTVGYGDNVPTSPAGRTIAVLVMLLGIGFLTVVTAAITSTFVAHARRVNHAPSDVETSVADQLRQLDSRLEHIEATLDRLSRPDTQ